MEALGPAPQLLNESSSSFFILSQARHFSCSGTSGSPLNSLDEEGQVVNRNMPSLLGRDILNHFTLTISPVHGVVELIEEEALPGSV